MGILEGKKAVILGASSGIGWAIAERFREQGAELIVAARREENLKKLSGKIGATAIRCDGRDHDDLKALADAAIEKWGRVDIAVNSAGIVRSQLIREIEPETLKEVADLQYFGFIYFMKHFGNAMAATGGSIVNITSATAIMVPIGLTPYSAAKAAINFATKIAAREFGPDNIRVNAVAPSFVPTAMNSYGGGTPIDEARVELPDDNPTAIAFIKNTPLERITTVDDCADVTLAVASDLFSNITGQIIPVDGGNHLLRLPGPESYPENTKLSGIEN
jgi:NAD(P)-dependent dehydrogenase (short-subunit alcohol dehydrogenase family)